MSILLLTGCSGRIFTVTVSNPTDSDRPLEMVEICHQQIVDALGDGIFVVKDSDGNEISHQVTYDGKVIFQTELKANESATYSIVKGKPSDYENLISGKQYPERADDFAWENDLVGFRAYGPALQASGEKGFGYDLFVKRGTHLPVLESFYDLALGERTDRIYQELLLEDADKAETYRLDSMTFHIDRGFGMDVYAVGPNMGAGVTALVDDEIIYPWCYKDYEILDNGPLRITFKLTFLPVAVGEDNNVVETRVISLDAGSYLNRTEVLYQNLTQPKKLVAGIVLRDKDGKETADIKKGYMAYPAPAMNFDPRRPDLDNGTHFIGHVYPETMSEMKTVYHSEKERLEERGGAPGHLLSYTEYTPGEKFTYYWGFGWEHSQMKTYDQWKEYLEAFAEMVKNPLIVNAE